MNESLLGCPSERTLNRRDCIVLCRASPIQLVDPLSQMIGLHIGDFKRLSDLFGEVGEVVLGFVVRALSTVILKPFQIVVQDIVNVRERGRVSALVEHDLVVLLKGLFFILGEADLTLAELEVPSSSLLAVVRFRLSHDFFL